MKHFYLLITTLLLFFAISLPTQIHALSPFDGCNSPADILLGKATSINTALGCISTTADSGENSFFASLIKIAVGLGGGFALLLILYGVFVVTTSAGIPDKLKEGSEIITSAVTGLLFIILSVFLLRLIGVNILGLPGLQ